MVHGVHAVFFLGFFVQEWKSAPVPCMAHLIYTYICSTSRSPTADILTCPRSSQR
jgi:hypothetical protein